jgi:hypothetical protein
MLQWMKVGYHNGENQAAVAAAVVKVVGERGRAHTPPPLLLTKLRRIESVVVAGGRSAVLTGHRETERLSFRTSDLIFFLPALKKEEDNKQ